MSEHADQAAPDWLDWDRAMRLVGDDPQLLQRLVAVFLRQYQAAPAELRAALNDADWKAASRRAHQLAGAAGAIAAVPLEQLARMADSAAQGALAAGGNHDLQQRARWCLDALVERLEATLAAASAWIEAG